MSKQDVYEHNPGFYAFYQKYGETVCQGILERITELVWDRDGKHEGLSLRDFHSIDVINSVISGTIEHVGVEWGFVIETGDRNGTRIMEWGEAEEVGTYNPPEPEKRYYVPANDCLFAEKPTMFQMYLQWRQPNGRIPEMEGKMNYDMFFQPGGKTWNHYSEWGAKQGLKIDTVMPNGMTAWDQKPDWSIK